MCKYPTTDETIGAFRGRVSNARRCPELLEWLERIPALVNQDSAIVLSSGRNRNILLETPGVDNGLKVVVKEFGKPSLVKNALDRSFFGSKARRTWLAAVHLDTAGVGTPEPIAFLERWSERRLVESYVVTVYEDGISDFKTELGRLFREEPECSKFITLMQRVADGVRAMHDAGFMHNDLGNQNILLRRCEDGNDWQDVRFIDLNRGRIKTRLSERERGRDISRIYLPSDLLRVFREMYYAAVPPRAFLRWEQRYRSRYARHAATRAWRHPIREYRKRHDPAEVPAYPHEKDMWIWDERSGQAQTILVSKDRHRYMRSRLFAVGLPTLKALFPVWREYRKVLRGAYANEVEMSDRVGVAIEILPGRFEHQMKLLRELGPVPVMVRFYRHRSDEETALAIDAVKKLHATGHAVSIALVQDRLAVRNPGAWHIWVGGVLEAVCSYVELVEVGHAINRVKWGIWDRDEYRKLVQGVAAYRDKYPGITFSGPAVIDFEYHYALAALDNLPEGFRFDAFSQHLYVDRRGAPENRQGVFSSLEKFALGKAIARYHENCGERFIVSEVNWPLQGTGVYSPVGSPYVSPGERRNDPSVSEDEYADYMLRYLLIALCSGLVERVFWWRLAAYGYGLVDDSGEEWRERPAFRMLVNFLRWTNGAIFTGHRELTKNGAVSFEFRRSDGGVFSLAYTTAGEEFVELAGSDGLSVADALGEPVAIENGRVRLAGRVVRIDGWGKRDG